MSKEHEETFDLKELTDTGNFFFCCHDKVLRERHLQKSVFLGLTAQECNSSRQSPEAAGPHQEAQG